MQNGSARIETSYLLQTCDEMPAFIVIKMQGWHIGPAHVLKASADPQLVTPPDPQEYSFRLFINLETGDSRYADEINYGMWVGSGMTRDTEVIYE